LTRLRQGFGGQVRIGEKRRNDEKTTYAHPFGIPVLPWLSTG